MSASSSDPDLQRTRSSTDNGSKKKLDQPQLQGSLTSLIVWAVTVATVGSSFIFGFSIGAVNAPQDFIKVWINESHQEVFHQELTEGGNNYAFASAVSIFSIGALIGALTSGTLANKFGRKGTLHFNNVFAILGSFMMDYAYWRGFYPIFHVGRFIIGLNAGIGSSVVPMFITEISPINWRGALGTAHQLVITISILVAQIVGMRHILGTQQLWPYIFDITLIPAIFQIIALFFVPESPKYTLVFRGDENEAIKDLCRYRNCHENDVLIEQEIKEIKKEAEAFKTEAKIGFMDLLGRALRWPTFLACFLNASQQFSGINAAMFYSTSIFKLAGLKDDWPIYATIIMGTVNVIQTGVSFWLVEHPKFGRRLLLLIGTIGMLVATILLTLSIFFAGDNYKGTAQTIASYSSIALIMVFVISFATGPGSIPFFYVNEVFASNARASAASLATGTNWTCNFLVALLFPILQDAIGPFVFLIFSGFLAISVAIILMWLPETKGKSVEEVEESMNQRKPRCC